MNEEGKQEQVEKSEQEHFLAEDLLLQEMEKPVGKRNEDLIGNLNDALLIQNRPDLKPKSKDLATSGLVPKALVDSEGRFVALRAIEPKK